MPKKPWSGANSMRRTNGNEKLLPADIRPRERNA